MSDYSGDPNDPRTRTREITACWLERADAQHAMDVLGSLYQVEDPVPPETVEGEPHWTLTIVIPASPGLPETDEALEAEIDAAVDRLDGSCRVDPGSGVIEEILRRLASPLDTWGPPTTHTEMMAAVERERDIAENMWGQGSSPE